MSELNLNPGFSPFDLIAGRSYSLVLTGLADTTGYQGADVKFTRGRRVFLRGWLEEKAGALTLNIVIPDDIVNGLFKAVISTKNNGRQYKTVIANAVRIMKTAHNGALSPRYAKWFYVVDEQGIPMKDVGGDTGYVRHPLVASYYVHCYMSYAFHYMKNHPPQSSYALTGVTKATAAEYLDNVLDWFRGEIEEGPEGSLALRHRFALPSHHLKPGWISGLTQGRWAEVCARLYQATRDQHWRELAIGCARIMWMPVEKGGLLAVDHYGDTSIEEYVTDPPNWSLNGIGSALASLEKVDSIISLPDCSDLHAAVCRSLERKMFLFDCPDKPGSRVQLAMSYPVGMSLRNNSWKNLKGPEIVISEIEVIYPSRAVKRIPLEESFAEAIELGYARAVSDRGIMIDNNAFFDLMLDGNNDPYDSTCTVIHTLILHCRSTVEGDIDFYIKSRTGDVALGSVAVMPGRNVRQFSFDPSDCLDEGIGRIARHDETYHETNLVWMDNISMHGALPHSRHTMRRWLFSKLTGLGRPPLVLDDNTLAILKREKNRLDREYLEEKNTEKMLIGELLDYGDSEAQVAVVLPKRLAANQHNRIHILGMGFGGNEIVRAVFQDEKNACRAPIRHKTISRDEVVVDIDLRRYAPSSFTLTITDLNDNLIGESTHEIV